jgi:hypothetical protein
VVRGAFVLRKYSRGESMNKSVRHIGLLALVVMATVLGGCGKREKYTTAGAVIGGGLGAAAGAAGGGTGIAIGAPVGAAVGGYIGNRLAK